MPFPGLGTTIAIAAGVLGAYLLFGRSSNRSSSNSYYSRPNYNYYDGYYGSSYDDYYEPTYDDYYESTYDDYYEPNYDEYPESTYDDYESNYESQSTFSRYKPVYQNTKQVHYTSNTSKESQTKKPNKRRKRKPKPKVNCSICLEVMKHGESISNLKCKHRFHTNCLRSWRERSKLCPLCRKVVAY